MPTRKSEERAKDELAAVLELEGRWFDKMSLPNSGVHRLLQAYGGPDILAIAEGAAKADAEAGFDPRRLVPTKREAKASLKAHIAAMSLSKAQPRRGGQKHKC